MLRHSYRIALLLAVSCLVVGPVEAALSVYMSPELLAERATLVLEGRVSRSASGYDAVRRTLATYVTLDVETVHRGPDGLSRVVLREAGGRFGELVHDVDAVPIYREGERVLVFLEPAADGALRTSGMFFGKFGLEQDSSAGLEAVRDLEGQGRILARPLGREERFDLDDLVASTAHADRPRRGSSGARASRPWLAEPPELSRLAWADGSGTGAALEAGSEVEQGSTHPSALGGSSAQPTFAPVSQSDPARWEQVDNGVTVRVHIDPRGNPLGDDLAAVAEVERAFAAWTGVPEARVTLGPGVTDYDFRGSQALSPAAAYSGVNIILFDDPYADLPDPIDCAGVLAIGGYWRSSAWTSQVNGRYFHPALQLYVILNDGFECILGDPDNLAEVLTHELGHGLGFGHSPAPDSIMRSFVYGQRGPRLGNDDRDAAHCTYPHRLTLRTPAAGASWAAGSSHTITWDSSFEAGGDAGTVSLEYWADPARGWLPIATETPNDGSHTWVLPADLPVTPDARVRAFRLPRGGSLPAGYPSACTLVTGPTFSITPACTARQTAAGVECTGARRPLAGPSGPRRKSRRP